jgi:hypothetical protein
MKVLGLLTPAEQVESSDDSSPIAAVIVEFFGKSAAH